MAALPEWHQQVLSRRLQGNPKVWAELVRRGVDETTELRLEFLYWAPGEAEAERLRAFLYEETDYDLSTAPAADPRPGATWVVDGRTQPTSVSLEILNEWAEWMVLAGAQNGGGVFDGWGTEIPSPPL